MDNKILVQVSAGELLDKISILKIKLEMITQEDKVKHIKNELTQLEKESAKLNIEKDAALQNLFERLIQINKKLWKIEDDIREKERQKKFDGEFIELARSVYYSNDERSKIKNEINQETNSAIFEVKGYSAY